MASRQVVWSRLGGLVWMGGFPFCKNQGLKLGASQRLAMDFGPSNSQVLRPPNTFAFNGGVWVFHLKPQEPAHPNTQYERDFQKCATKGMLAPLLKSLCRGLGKPKGTPKSCWSPIVPKEDVNPGMGVSKKPTAKACFAQSPKWIWCKGSRIAGNVMGQQNPVTPPPAAQGFGWHHKCRRSCVEQSPKGFTTCLFGQEVAGQTRP